MKQDKQISRNSISKTSDIVKFCLEKNDAVKYVDIQ